MSSVEASSSETMVAAGMVWPLSGSSKILNRRRAQLAIIVALVVGKCRKACYLICEEGRIPLLECVCVYTWLQRLLVYLYKQV